MYRIIEYEFGKHLRHLFAVNSQDSVCIIRALTTLLFQVITHVTSKKTRLGFSFIVLSND